MDDKRNLIAAILLSVAILLGWNFVADKVFPTPAEPPAKSEGTKAAAPAATEGQPGVLPAPAVPAAATVRPLAAALADGHRIPIITPAIQGSINLVGARIDDVTLSKYRETIKKDSPPVRLFAPGGTKAAYFAGVAWSGTGVAVPDAATTWTADGARLTPDSPVTLTWANTTGQTFRIVYSIDRNYLITAKQSVTNAGPAPVVVASGAYIARLGKPIHPEDQGSATIHVGPMGAFNGAAKYDVSYANLEGQESGFFSRMFGNSAKAGINEFASTGGWVGFTDKYWLAAVAPMPKDRIEAQMRMDDGLFKTNFIRPPVHIAAGATGTSSSYVFAGAKETSLLSEYQDKYQITHLNRAIDWGWFEFFEKPIFRLLDWLFRLVGNFGVAIMILTLIIRAAMFPIAQRQFQSMAQMRVVQPKMKALQERLKDDKPKMQQELMKLYKDEKINPLAGCLPILIQIPIFYALYKVLMLTIEMRHQPFALWIKDLSAPDPAHILNLFGLLPFTPPSLLAIGPLALVLGVTMFLQFRLNPAPADPVQEQVFKIMPWLFMFIMAPFAAGLLLYWITNNILSIGQQQWMYRKYPALKTAVAK